MVTLSLLIATYRTFCPGHCWTLKLENDLKVGNNGAHLRFEGHPENDRKRDGHGRHRPYVRVLESRFSAEYSDLTSCTLLHLP